MVDFVAAWCLFVNPVRADLSCAELASLTGQRLQNRTMGIKTASLVSNNSNTKRLFKSSLRSTAAAVQLSSRPLFTGQSPKCTNIISLILQTRF